MARRSQVRLPRLVRGSTPASAHDALLLTLKRALRSRGLSYRELGERIGLSESGVKKLLTADDIALGRLRQIAAVLELPLAELIVEGQRAPIEEVTLGAEVQRALLREPRCFACYWLLAVERRSPAQIAREHGVDRGQVLRWISRLDDLGLLTLEGGNRVRVPDLSLVRWMDAGPLLEHLDVHWSRRLVADAREEGEGRRRSFRLHQLRLLPETAESLVRDLEALVDDYRRRSRLEAVTADPRQSEAQRVLVASAPGSFVSGLEDLPARRRS